MGRKRTLPKSEKKIPVLIQLKENTDTKLKNYSENKNVSKSEVVQKLLDEFLENS